MLEQLAEKARRTAGDWLRQTIREQHAATFGAPKRSKRPPKR